MGQSITAGFYMEIVEVMVTTLIRMNILEFCSGVCYAKGALEIGLVPYSGKSVIKTRNLENALKLEC